MQGISSQQSGYPYTDLIRVRFQPIIVIINTSLTLGSPRTVICRINPAVLSPAKRFFHALTVALTDLIATMTAGATINRRAARTIFVTRNLRRLLRSARCGSITVYSMYESLASLPGPFLAIRASPSVLNSCVSVLRFSPWKSASPLQTLPQVAHRRRHYGGSSFATPRPGSKVPSTLKCSSDSSFRFLARLTSSSNSSVITSLSSSNSCWH